VWHLPGGLLVRGGCVKEGCTFRGAEDQSKIAELDARECQASVHIRDKAAYRRMRTRSPKLEAENTKLQSDKC